MIFANPTYLYLLLLLVGVRCRDFTLPALLSAIFRKHSWIGKVVPPGNALVHYLVDFPDFPLLRLVKGVI